MLSLACNMLPTHPRAAGWDEAAKRYMYNAISVAADQQDGTPGDDGRPVNRWVTTVNAHPDFTVENHRLVHVGYLKLTVEQLSECAAHYLLGGGSVPKGLPASCFRQLARAVPVHELGWRLRLLRR